MDYNNYFHHELKNDKIEYFILDTKYSSKAEKDKDEDFNRKMCVLHTALDVKKVQDKIRSYLEDDKDTKNIAELDKIRKHN